MATPTRFKKNLAGETQNLLKQLINNRTQVDTEFCVYPKHVKKKRKLQKSNKKPLNHNSLRVFYFKKMVIIQPDKILTRISQIDTNS
jgi:hypothetical protein